MVRYIIGHASTDLNPKDIKTIINILKIVSKFNAYKSRNRNFLDTKIFHMENSILLNIRHKYRGKYIHVAAGHRVNIYFTNLICKY